MCKLRYRDNVLSVKAHGEYQCLRGVLHQWIVMYYDTHGIICAVPHLIRHPTISYTWLMYISVKVPLGKIQSQNHHNIALGTKLYIYVKISELLFHFCF